MSEPLPPLNSDDVKRVQKIFVLLLGDMDGFARTLYERLFEVAPEVEPLFNENMDAQREVLVSTLTTIVNHARCLIPDETEFSSHDERETRAALKRLGHRHQVLGVTPQNYDQFAEVFSQALDTHLGAKLDEASRGAWNRFYAAIASIMQSGSAAQHPQATH